MKTIGADYFYARLNKIFKDGNPTKEQIMDAYDKSIKTAVAKWDRLTLSDIAKRHRTPYTHVYFAFYEALCIMRDHIIGKKEW